MNDPLITADEVATLNAARDLLDAIYDRCSSRVLNGTSANDSMFLGQVRHAASAAGNAVFGVLNHAASSGFAEITTEQMHRGQL